MTFQRRRYECETCGEAFIKLAWNTDPPPMHCDAATVETPLLTTLSRNLGVIDDQLEGGPRRFETMGDDAPYLSTKSEWRRELARRGLECVGDRHPPDYYARHRRQHMEQMRDTAKDRDR